jgi:hypothetical protein
MLNLKDYNEAVKFQARMDNHHAIIFARCIPHHQTDQLDWNAVREFELYAEKHPENRDALVWLHNILIPRLVEYLDHQSGLTKLFGAF